MAETLCQSCKRPVGNITLGTTLEKVVYCGRPDCPGGNPLLWPSAPVVVCGPPVALDDTRPRPVTPRGGTVGVQFADPTPEQEAAAYAAEHARGEGTMPVRVVYEAFLAGHAAGLRNALGTRERGRPY
jgi:hypothetical protein